MKPKSKPLHVLFSSLSAIVSLAAFASPAFAQQAPPEENPPALPPANEPSVVIANRPAAATPAASASAADTPAAQEPEGAPRYDLIRINVGLRVGYIPDQAFDAFSSNDVLPQFSIDGTYPLLTSGKLVLAAGVGWDVGGRRDTVRGLTSSLGSNRLYVPIEGRYHIKPWLYGFGKIAPGAVAMHASVKDPSVPDTLSTTAWAFSADASIGASILMGPRARPDKRGPRFWVTPEIGWSFTTAGKLNVNPNRDEDQVLGSDENTNLKTLALSGLFWRASIGTTF